MKLHRVKFFISIFIVLVYLSIGVFGLLQFSHASHSEAPMLDCPYAPSGYSLCSNNLDHINNWQQFSNIILPTLFIFSLLIFGFILYLLHKQDLLNQNQYFYQRIRSEDNKKLYSYPDIITKWLSLFENSPSYSYVRHS